jgi:hypothetical protein
MSIAPSNEGGPRRPPRLHKGRAESISQRYYNWTILARPCSLSITNPESNDLLDDLKTDLSANVELDEKKSRVYVIRLVKGKMKGRFIFGRRRNPRWAGFGGTGEDTEDSSNE